MFSLIDTRSLFKLYSFYTATLAILLLSLYLANDTLHAWRTPFPKILPLVLSAYGTLSGINIITAYAAPWSNSDKLTPYFLAEIIILGGLLLFVAPHQGELGLMLLITVAMGSLILSSRLGYLVAAIATLVVLGHSIVAKDNSIFVENSLLATMFFLEAWLVTIFKSRLRSAEVDVKQQKSELKKVARMNDLIVDRMQTGVCLVKSTTEIISINRAAQERFGDIPANGLPEVVYERLAQWREFKKQNESPVLLPDSNQRLLLSFAEIDETTYVIFIDDLRVVTQKAQQLKLASLGRMAASIAHEIRNPLSAISHAAQLLAESPHLDEDDLRLCEIISSHTTRVDSIIQNVLQISRRKTSDPKILDLLPWLEVFQKDFKQHHHAEFIVTMPEDLQVLRITFDPSQLHQVLWNLCENVLNHAHKRNSAPIEFKIGFKETGRGFLTVCDQGEGIPKEQESFLFEPFHTTSAKGTGLGLFIVKELCEANHSEIRYDRCDDGGACFEILFAHRQANKKAIAS